MYNLLRSHNIQSLLRLSYPAGQTKGATWTEVASNIPCHLRTMNEQQAAVNNYQWGRAFNLQFISTIDIQEGDKVIIKDVTYLVRGVGEFGGNEPYKKAIMTLPEKQ